MKREYGQFYTTNSEYIIGNLLSDLPGDLIVVEPFVGNGDLLIFNNGYEIYDIDPRIENTIQRDTILNPPDYINKLVVSNPPYLYRNKSTDKTIYDLYNVNDLYKAFIKTILDSEGGILILPLNFLCDDDSNIRKVFFSKFQIININIFEEQVFDDTTYTVCSFSFRKRTDESNILNCKFYPSGNYKTFELNEQTGFKIGSDFLEIIKNQKNIGIRRLIKGGTPNSNLYLRSIDSGSMDGRISLTINDTPYYGKESDRTFATIILDRDYNEEDQLRICTEFNRLIEYYRDKYNSLFLSNYRNSTSLYARKRISFYTAYKIISYIIESGINSNIQ